MILPAHSAPATVFIMSAKRFHVNDYKGPTAKIQESEDSFCRLRPALPRL